MIEIDRKAEREIRRLYHENPGKYLRIAVDGDGCAGPYFALSLEEAGSEEELTRINGIDLLVSDGVQRYAKVTTVNIRLNPRPDEI